MKNKSGLGDIIENITEKTGIKAAVEFLEEKFDFDCGCEERKQKLNMLFPYKTECLTEDEYNYLKSYDFNKQTLSNLDQQNLLRIFNRVFNQNNQMTSCSACWNSIINNLRKLFNEYEHN